MKKWKLFTAAVLSAVTLVTSVWTVPVYAEEGDVTEKPSIDITFSERVVKKISKADADVINEAFGYEWGSNIVSICPEGSKISLNLENSEYGHSIYEVITFSPALSRDENGNLMIEKSEGKIGVETDWISNNIRYRWNSNTNIYEITDFWTIGDGFWLLDDEDGNIEDYVRKTISCDNYVDENGDWIEVPVTDVYIIRFVYPTEGNPWGNDEWYYGVTDFWILPEGVETVLHLEDIEEEPAPSEEQYEVDLTNSTEPMSKETFATLLEENKTKDVVISSNNGVTFTFKAGTMTEVEGKEAYDFSTSIQNTYESTMPSYVTANNFVSQINFNYSGILPADAYIRFSVGTQYAGQTLYYSLMNEAGTFAEVQAVTVDAEGYMTVKQNHCSSYVVTTENPDAPTQTPETPSQPETPTQPEQTQTPAPETQPEQTPAQTPESAPEQTQTTQKTSPKTGEQMFVTVGVLAFISISAVAAAMFGKKRSMR